MKQKIVDFKLFAPWRRCGEGAVFNPERDLDAILVFRGME